MEKKVCEFDIQSLLPIGLTLVVAGIGIAYGLSVMGDMKSDFYTLSATCNETSGVLGGCSADYNATVNAVEGVAKIPEKLPLIVTVVIAAIIIGILVRYLMVRFA